MVELNELPGTVTVSTQDPIKLNMKTIILLPPSSSMFSVSPTSRTVGLGEGNGLIHFLLTINCTLSVSDWGLVCVLWEIRSLPLPIRSEDTYYFNTIWGLYTNF